MNFYECLGNNANGKVVVGSIGLGVTNVNASYVWPIASGTDITVTAKSGGAGGNALDFQATNDGCGKSALDLSLHCTNISTIVQCVTGGTSGDNITVEIVRGAATKAGVLYEDDVHGRVVIALKDSLSTVADFEALVGASTMIEVGSAGTASAVFESLWDMIPPTNLSGGTPITWAESNGSPVKMHLHYTHGITTVAQAIAAINAPVGTGYVTATGSGSHTIANGDLVTKQDLSGGVDAITLSGLLGIGYTAAKTGTGSYTLTFDREFDSMIAFIPKLQLHAATDRYAIGGTYTKASKTLVINIWDKSAGALTDAGISTYNRLNFVCVFI